MKRKHPRILFLHWSRYAYRPGDEIEMLSQPLFPRITLEGSQRWSQMDHFAPQPGSEPPPALSFFEVTGPVSDDVVPIIFGFDHRGVYLRVDVADHLRPHLGTSQRLTPVRCDGEVIPYLALTDAAPEVWLPEKRTRNSCDNTDNASDFDDGHTMISTIFPDAFPGTNGVHLVGNHGNVFLDTVLWLSLRRGIPSVAQWLEASNIVVDSDIDALLTDTQLSLSGSAPEPASVPKKTSRRESFQRAQAVTTVTIGGRSYDRLPFDADTTEDTIEHRGDFLCGHCEVAEFSYHLLGCEAERCPRCGGQIISCACDLEQRPGQPPLI